MQSKTEAVRKVVFADYASVKFTSLERWLKKENVVSESVTNAEKFLELIKKEYFEACIVNLLMGGMGPFQFITKIREVSMNSKLKIIVLSKQVHKSNIENSIKAGANDFIADPFENENLFRRIMYHLAPKQTIQEVRNVDTKLATKSNEFISLLLGSIDLLAKAERKESHEAFVEITQKIAGLLGSNRTSLIIVDRESASGVVIASSDDPSFYDFLIKLEKYPEILHVVNTGTIVLVEDVSQNMLTANISKKVKIIEIGSLMVFPIRFHGEVVGVLTVRRPRAANLPEMDALSVIQALANIMAAHANTENVLHRLYKEYRSAGNE